MQQITVLINHDRMEIFILRYVKYIGVFPMIIENCPNWQLTDDVIITNYDVNVIQDLKKSGYIVIDVTD